MPFPNEHACRIKPPGGFQKDSFRRLKPNGDNPLVVIIGRPKGKTTTTTQAFRYPKSKWTEAKARAHCEEKGGSFEPASNEGLFEFTYLARVESIVREGKNFALIHAIDTSMNKNDWGVTDKGLRQALDRLIGTPVMAQTPDGHKTDWEIGAVKNYRFNGGVTIEHEVTDPEAWDHIHKKKDWNTISPKVIAGKILKTPEGEWLDTFDWVHFCYVDDPAYSENILLDSYAAENEDGFFKSFEAAFHSHKRDNHKGGIRKLSEDDKTPEQLEAELKVANKSIEKHETDQKTAAKELKDANAKLEKLEGEFNEFKEAHPEDPPELEDRVHTLEAELKTAKKLKEDLDKKFKAIEEDHHLERISEVLDARENAGLCDDREAELKMFRSYSAEHLAQLKADAERIVKLAKVIRASPKAKYTTEDETKHKERVAKIRARVLGPGVKSRALSLIDMDKENKGGND